MGKLKVNKGVLREFQNDGGFSDWFNEDDFEACTESPCEACGKQTLEYHGFKGYGERHAVSVCKSCGDEQEF